MGRRTTSRATSTPRGAASSPRKEAAGGKSPVVSIPTDWLYEVAPRRMVGVKFIYQYGSIFDNGKAARDLGFRTTVPLVETFRRQIAWSERAGTYRRADEEPLQDVLLDAFTRGQKPAPGQVHDFNPWGNEPES
ncbi:hypothetical protein WME98_00095 [Sorangium sp. So ce296]|uniref:hypothetical protein n=1 Tax=Sorangium sp. So ce296 TaxID=3133296 RepID=UPI003F63FDD1